MDVRTKQSTDRSLIIVISIVAAMAVLFLGAILPFTVSATIVQERFIKLENSQPSGVGIHQVGFTITDFSSEIGSLRFEYCGNNPIIGTPCVPPDDFDASNVTIVSQDGETGFSVHPDSDDNNIILTRTAVLPTEAELVYELDEIINPSDLGSFYGRIYTYTTEDASGPHTQSGGVALSTNLDLNVEAEVPPYLTFCSGVVISGLDCGSIDSFFINLGEFSVTQTTAASSQMLAATNAANGYTIRVSGTSLTSGNNIIDPIVSPAVSQPGTNQFGINLRNNNTPNVGANPVGPGTATPTGSYNTADQFMFNDDDAVVTSPVPSDIRKFTISYITNINNNQAPGIYSTTVSYLALANF